MSRHLRLWIGPLLAGNPRITQAAGSSILSNKLPQKIPYPAPRIPATPRGIRCYSCAGPVAPCADETDGIVRILGYSVSVHRQTDQASRSHRCRSNTRPVHDNLRNLDVDVLDVVNIRNMFDDAARAGESIEAARQRFRLLGICNSFRSSLLLSCHRSGWRVPGPEECNTVTVRGKPPHLGERASAGPRAEASICANRSAPAQCISMCSKQATSDEKVHDASFHRRHHR